MLRQSAYVCLLLAALFAASFLGVGVAPADQGGIPHMQGEVIIKFKDNASQNDKDRILAELGGSKIKGFGRIKAELRRLDEGMTVEEAISRVQGNSKIEYIEPNYIWNAEETPNDPLFPQLWGMENTGQTGGTAGADIHATNAWDVFTGSSNVLVGVIDTGIDYTHPDLAANVWTNPNEIPNNGIDDDMNGYVDDIHGWDFYNDDNDPMDDHGHGSHVSGTIGGVGDNGIGVAGVNWHIKIMGLKFLSSSGSGSTADAVDAIDYATMMGVKLTSNSWGGGGFSQALLDAINAANNAGILFVAAAGNSGVNTDNSPHYPSAYSSPNIISVAATDHNDNIASFSNYGATTVDIAAPGVDILSTFPGNQYGTISGTSMATPHVSGALGLVFGRFPNIGHLDAKNLIMNFADPIPSMVGKCVTEGRLNAFLPIAEPDSIPPGAVMDLTVTNAGSNWLDIGWSAPGDDGATGTASRYIVKVSASPIDAANFDAATTVPNPPDPGPAGTPESMHVDGLDFDTTYYLAVKGLDEFGNAADISNVPSGTTLGIPDIAATPLSFSTTLLTGATESQNLTLSNVGFGTLDFQIPAPQLITNQPLVADYVGIGKGVEDTRPGILGTGGPDGFGYRWTDSDDAAGPAFNWIDISGTGTAAITTGDDVNEGPFPIGFSFPFYGVEYTTFRVCSNGWLSFNSSSTAYDNQPLPNGGAPTALLAPFWDDLNPTTTGEVYYESDGSRLIVQWQNVAHYGSGGPYTFQAILHSDGTIEYQYLSMGSPMNSATIGIQNAARTDGLQVVFNDAYVHDSMAIRIGAVPQWVTVTPSEGTIYAPNSLGLSVDFDAAGLLGGTYDANILILSNDPDESPFSIPVQLTVIGAPDVDLAPDFIDFGEVFLGATPVEVLEVQNPGTDSLHVSSITVDDAVYSLDATSFVVPPRSSRSVNITFAPVSVGTYPAMVTVLSDDPDQPSISMNLTGIGVVPPDFSVTPTSLSSNLLTGESETQMLTLSNSGGADLEWSVGVEFVSASQVYTLTAPDPYGTVLDADTGSPEAQGRTEPIQAELDDLTGIDILWDRSHGQTTTSSWTTFIADLTSRGATLTQSTDPITPALLAGYDILWSVDLTGTWTPDELSALASWMNGGGGLLLEGDNTATVPIYNDILSALGAGIEVSQTDGSSGVSANIHPHETTQNVNGVYFTANTASIGVIASPAGPLVDDDEGVPAVAYSQVAGGRIIVATDEIFQSSRMDDADNQLFGNQVFDWLAGAVFITATPLSGTIPPGGSANVDVMFDATGLFGGLYEANLNITTNDPLALLVPVPVSLQVTGAPDLALDPMSTDFGDVYVGYPDIHEFEILNAGTDVLNISNITSNEPAFSAFLGSGSFPIVLDPLATTVIQVRFSPPTPDAYAGMLTIFSNDPDTPETHFAMSGNGLLPPLASVSPTSLHADLLTNETEVQQFVVSNTGATDLNWEALLSFSTAATSLYTLPGATPPSEPEADGGTASAAFNTDPIQVELADLTGVDILWDRSHGQSTTSAWTTIIGDLEARGATVTQNTDPLTPTLLQAYDVYWSIDPSSTASWDPAEIVALVDWVNAGGGLLFEGDNSNSVTMWNELLTALASGIEMTYTSGAAGTTTNIYPHSTTANVNAIYLTANLAILSTVMSPAAPLVDDADGDGNTAYSLVGAGRVMVAADEIFGNSRMGTDDNRLFGNQAMDWLSTPVFLAVNPGEGVIPPGGNTTVNVTFDAGGLFGGDYNALVRVLSNDPAHGAIDVAASMTVTGVPRVAWEPEPLDLGEVYLGYPESMTLLVTNVGTDELTITAMTPGLPDWSMNPGMMTLMPLETVEVQVTLDPQAVGDRSTMLTIVSNDPDSPHMASLMGYGLLPPIASVDPDSLHADLLTGDIEVHQVTLSNTGASDLDWETQLAFDTPVLDLYTLTAPEPYETTLDVDTGSPDASGGRIGPIQAELADLTGIHIMWDRSHGQGSSSLWTTIIADFESRGATFTENTDTWTPELLGGYDVIWTQDVSNTPDPAEMATLVDWVNAGGGVLLEGDNASTVTVYNNILTALGAGIEFSTTSGASGTTANIYPHETTQNVTGIYLTANVASIPTIMSPGGPLFDDVDGVGAGAYSTVGAGRVVAISDEVFQNSRMDDADNQLFGNQVMDYLSVPVFLSVSPEAGTVPAGGSSVVDVTYDATGLYGGDYSAHVRFLSNDPANPELHVAATMHVTPVPRVAWEPEPLDFGDVFIGYPQTMALTVSNVGTAHLSVNSMTPGLPDWSVDTQALELDPLEPAVVQVTFDPQGDGDRSTMLSIVSNDPDSPHMASLNGSGLYPPIVGTSPDTVEGAAPPGGMKHKTLTLCNTGGSDLEWSAGARATGMLQVFTLAAPEPFDTTPDVDTGQPDPSGGRTEPIQAELADLTGVEIMWDRAHGQSTTSLWTTIIGDFEARGATVTVNTDPFTPALLAGYDVIWWVDTDEAPTPDELTALADWMQAGGALLLEGDNTSSVAIYNTILSTLGAGITYTTTIGSAGVSPYIFPHPTTEGVTGIYFTGNVATLTDPVPPGGLLVSDDEQVPSVAYSEVGSGRIVASADEIFQNSRMDDADNQLFGNQVMDWLGEPGWLSVTPESGVLPAGECTNLDVLLDASDLMEGDYAGAVLISSNDPATPTDETPVLFHVRTIEASYTDVEPNTLNLGATGNWVKATVELPEPYMVSDIVLETVRLQGTIPAATMTVGDDNMNGIPDAVFKFDRSALEGALSVGDSVEVSVEGEVRDTVWFMGTDWIRAINPQLQMPNGGEQLLAGQAFSIQWANPVGWEVDHAVVTFSPDGGQSWSLVADNVIGESTVWMVPGSPTSDALIRIYLYDDTGIIGSDTSDEPFLISNQTVGAETLIPVTHRLYQNTPNPFRSNTRIAFDLPAEAPVTLRVFDVSGRVVRTLSEGMLPAGTHYVSWDGRDESGRSTAAGVYFYQLRAGDYTANMRMFLVH